MTSQNQVAVECHDTKSEVDRKLTAIIESCSKLGICTLASYPADDRHYCSIDFFGSEAATHFINIIAQTRPLDATRPWLTLYNRIYYFKGPGGWTYDMEPLDLEAIKGLYDDGLISTEVRPEDPTFCISISFPASDLLRIERRLKAEAKVAAILATCTGEPEAEAHSYRKARSLPNGIARRTHS